MCSAETTILQQLVLLVPSSFSTDPMCFPVKMRNTLRVNLSTRTTRTRKLKDVDISPDRTGQKECEKTSASWISGFSYEQRVHTLTCFSSILMLIQSNMKQDLSSCATMPVGYVEYRDKVWQECVHHVNSPSSWKMVMSEKWKWMEFWRSLPIHRPLGLGLRHLKEWRGQNKTQIIFCPIQSLSNQIHSNSNTAVPVCLRPVLGRTDDIRFRRHEHRPSSESDMLPSSLAPSPKENGLSLCLRERSLMFDLKWHLKQWVMSISVNFCECLEGSTLDQI